MDDCIFCKMTRGEIKVDIVHESSGALAFLDQSPITPGHTLVIPKVHAANISEASHDSIGPTFIAVQAVVKLLKATLAPDGFTIGVNHGKAAGQAIDHLHIHVLPRWADDHGITIHQVVKNPPESYEAVKEKIMKGLE
ncbi:MAG: HIT family protein [Candidatus Jorgensenbacteria bacterium]|nr:HIT family protein [Candidatus Jorgensenbacteria bacterium]